MKSDSLKKEKITDPITGEQKLRFSVPTIQIKAEVKLLGVHLVKEDEEMRIDIISNLYYGSTDFVDLIMKTNGISNPFSIKAGQFLLIPDKNSAEQYRKKIKKISNKPRTQFTDPKRMSQQDAKRKKFLEEKSKSKPNGSSENLPPNMLKSDQAAKIFKDDKIILGTHLKTNNRNRK
jgi:hypothetical protein